MSVKTGGVAVARGFDPAPAVGAFAAVGVDASAVLPIGVDAIGVLVSADGEVPAEVGHDRTALEAAGFEGTAGQSLVLPQGDGPPRVAVGMGPATSVDADGLRDAAGTFARAAGDRARLALVVPSVDGPCWCGGAGRPWPPTSRTMTTCWWWTSRTGSAGRWCRSVWAPRRPSPCSRAWSCSSPPAPYRRRWRPSSRPAPSCCSTWKLGLPLLGWYLVVSVVLVPLIWRF